MENPNLYEYGLDVEAFEEFYEELQDLLEDENIYDSNENLLHRLDDSWIQRLIPVIPNIVMLVLAFTLTFIIPFVSQGLLRGIYLLKSILSGFSNALVVVQALLRRHAHLRVIEQGTDVIVPWTSLVPHYLSEACALFAAAFLASSCTKYMPASRVWKRVNRKSAIWRQ